MVEVEHTSVLQQGPWTEHHCMDITSYHLFSLPLPPSHHVWTARLHQESAIWYWKIWFVVGAEKAQCFPHRPTIPDEECCEVITVCTALPMKKCRACGKGGWAVYGCVRVALVAEAHEGWGGQTRCVAGTVLLIYLLYLFGRYEALGICASYLQIICNLWFNVSSFALYKAKKWPLHSAFCCHGFWWWRQILGRAPWLHLRDVKSHAVEHWVYNKHCTNIVTQPHQV